MIRNLLILIALILIYYSIKAIIRSALKSYHEENESGRPKLKGEEMVLDPACKTYVVKDRAVTRRVNGKTYSFCSEACARQFEEKKGR